MYPSKSNRTNRTQNRKSNLGTDARAWNRLKLSETGKNNFPVLYRNFVDSPIRQPYSVTWDVSPISIRNMPLASISNSQLRQLKRFGFHTSNVIGKQYSNMEIAVPLLNRNQHVGSFLAAYRRRNRASDIDWVKYTCRDEVCPETPLIAISGNMGQKPSGVITDCLKGYLKLLYLLYDERVYAISKKRPVIIYLDQNKEDALDVIRKNQIHFSSLTVFTNSDIKNAIVNRVQQEHRKLFVDELITFDQNPLPFCFSRSTLQESIRLFGNRQKL